jgi:ATP-dependent DNA helicase RecG
MSPLEEPLRHVLGENTAKVLAKSLGLHTVGDLLRHYPRRYAERGELTDLAQLRVDEHVTVLAEVKKVSVRPMRNRPGTIVEAVVTDGKGQLTLTFFGKRQGWRGQQLQPGRRGLFAGKVTTFKGARQLAHPEYQLLDDEDDATVVEQFAGALIPVYAPS